MDNKITFTRQQISNFITEAKTLKQFEDMVRLLNNLTETVKGIGITQVYTPSGTGFSATVGNDTTIPFDNNIKLFLDITGTLASGTVVFPEKNVLREGQEITLSTKGTVTSLTIDIQDVTTIVGAIATLSTGGFAVYRYSVSEDTWFRVG